jgi:hypothetical protein
MMKKMQTYAIILFISIIAATVLLPAVANADRCLVVYPEALAEYHYDMNEYFTVSFGDPLYDPMYDRGGEVLIDSNDLGIAYDIYQAPNLIGFEPSTDGQEGYFTIGNEFKLIIDGFHNQPTTYENVILVFEPDPDFCVPQITVDGVLATSFTFPVGNLAVSTPTEQGNNFSDVITFDIYWSNCYGLRIWAYADENYNGMLDGGECFTAFSHDVTVPADTETWGSIKARYSE